MVFESIVVEILNRFLGDYVENLDSNQLNIGIWGGDVVLKDLILKQSALADLDLPVQTVYGRLGKLVLKIPWKDLYGSPVVASVEGLYLLVQPNLEVKYNAAKEEKREIDQKQKELLRIETARKKSEETDKPKADPGFVEKLTTQIIKNVQLKIADIHIRYEDKITNPGHPFSMGITLCSLAMESTNENWVPGIVQDTSTKIYKIVEMEALALYWNSNTEFYANLAVVDKKLQLGKTIARKDLTPENYYYILGPINSSARLRLNPKPEEDVPAFSIPKIHANLDMEKLSLGITKGQYQDIMALVDSMNLMLNGTAFRKYRPDVPTYHGYYKKWWLFAYKCVLESQVRRVKRNWDWNHINEHRQSCKKYATLYQTKLHNKKPVKEIDDQVLELEKKLDVTNLVIIRQRIQMEVERLGKQHEEVSKKSWFSSWWGGSKDADQDLKTSTDLLKQFEEAMTPAEKAKLFKAIDYQEHSSPAEYPISFVDTTCTFVLRKLEVHLLDDSRNYLCVVNASLNGVKCRLDTRPAGNSIKVAVNIDNLGMKGVPQEEFIPDIIFSDKSDTTALLDILFETNPINKNYGQSLYVLAKPLRIIYDAQTINQAIELFKVPKSSTLEQISVAGAGLNNFKEMSSLGLQYAISQHSHLNLEIELHAPYIIVPYGGKYLGVENVLVANLGTFRITTEEKKLSVLDVRKMHNIGTAEEDILKEMINASYDKFIMRFTDLQLVLAQSGEDWLTAINQSKVSSLHILQPLTLEMKFYKCLIMDDPRLPHAKIRGNLESLTLNISDAQILQAISLMQSIPFPKSEEEQLNKMMVKGISSLSIANLFETVDKKKSTAIAMSPNKKQSDLVQFTKMDVNFIMNELSVTLGKLDYDTNTVRDAVSFKAKKLTFELLQQTFNMDISVSLLSIGFDIFRDNPKIVNVISTPMDQEKSLFTVKFISVNKKSPEFHTVYHSCESFLSLDFTKLVVLVHQEAIQELLLLINNLQTQLEDIRYSHSIETVTSLDSANRDMKRTLSTVSENIAQKAIVQKRILSKWKKADPVVESIIFKLVAELQELTIQLTSDKGDVAVLDIRGLKGQVVLKKPYTQISVNLNNISVIDLNKQSLHSQILSVVGEEAVQVQVVLYNLDKEVDIDKTDMKIYANLGQLRIVFLNWFIMNILDFLNQFQAAQTAIVEASQLAAENAKHNLQTVYEKSTRILLSINLKAPYIIVPENSQSFSCLLLDMGNLTLTNKFKDFTDITNENGYHAVIDEMMMKLTDFKLIRAIMKPDYSPINSTTILHPMTVTFSVKRNLSNSWYKALPDIDISGHITTIDLLMSQLDYGMIMSVIEGNLNEGKTKTAQITEAKVSKIQRQNSKLVAHTMDASDAILETEEDGNFKPDVKVTTFIKLTFSMDSFILNLYICDEKQPFAVDKYNGLARFSLEGLAIKASIFSDDTISTSLLLVNCLLDDTRKGRAGKLNRLIERKQDVEFDPEVSADEVSLTKSMIDLTLQMKKNDIFFDLRVYSFTVIISVDYLKTIAGFFTNYMQSASTAEHPVVNKTKSKVLSEQKSVLPAEKKKTPMITVNLKIEKPDIVLVEHMDNIDTKALILNSEILVKLRLIGNHQVINGTVKDIQLYTCAYNPSRRVETRGTVLHPVSISIAGSTPDNKGLHVEVHITDVKLCISPATLELLNRCYVTAVGADVKAQEEIKKEVDYSDIWNTKPFKEQDFWFLRTELAEDALNVVPVEIDQGLGVDMPRKKEICLISMPVLIVTIEAGVGNKTLPMLILESGFQGNVKNWSSQISIDASLTVEMGYYNSTLAVWEPLVEPIASITEDTIYTPWELKFEMSMIDREFDVSATSPTLEEQPDVPVRSAAVTIDIMSKSTLELTVTKTCLEVLHNLGKAFASAIQLEEMKTTTISAPYVLKNDSGTKITLLLRGSSFKMYDLDDYPDEIVLESGAEIFLDLNKSEDKSTNSIALSKDRFHEKKEEIYLRIKVNEMNTDLDLPIVRADKRYFPLNYRRDNGDAWGLISSIKVEDGVQVITLRSILHIENHFNIPVDVYYMTSRGNELECIATIQPGSFYNVPFKAVYSPTNELFFSVNGYSITTSPFIWKDLQLNLSINKLLHCASKSPVESTEPFVIKAVGETEQIYFENTNRHTMASSSYNVHLRPAVVLKNCLPVDIICCVQDVIQEKKLGPGDSLQLPNVNPGHSKLVLRIPDYLEKEWSCNYDISGTPQPLSVWQFNSYDSVAKVSLDLGMHVLDQKGSITMSLYCPFWMINKTGLMLGYRSSDENLNVLHHPPTFKDPILFSFNAKNFFGKKKASVRIGQGEWSDKFSLDVAGSSGVVVCKSNNMIYQIGVHNQLTYNGLTKQVTFIPYYVAINNSPYHIECQELDRPGDPWLQVEPQSCSSIWPRSEQEDKLLRLRIKDTEEISAPFLFTESHTTLLKLKNKHGGINVDIQMTEGAIYINFTNYQPGFSPALIVNHTRDTLRLWEKENVQIRKLEPYHSVLYTWDNPSGSRILAWDTGNNKDMEDDLRKDDIGEFCPRENQTVYWISFLDGMQRVLLFTEDQTVADEAQSAKQFEEQQQEINVSIHGVGLSLINNYTRHEIMYIGIASTGIIWQQSKSPNKRYKQMNVKDSHNLEMAYQQYLERDISTEDVGHAFVDSKTEVDFVTNIMLKPHKRYIKRTFQTGLWIQMKSSLHQMQLHAKINRIQIDNQMYDCIFPVVLAPVPPPKSVAVNSFMKPFAELSIVQLLIKNSQIKQYKYFKILIQEFHVKVDLGFINSLMETLQTSAPSVADEKQYFLNDIQFANDPLFSHVSSHSLQEQKSFYDLLHFSPLKIHVSFSMASNGSASNQLVNSPVAVLLQGLGVTLTDLQDVVFKLAYFERNYTFLTRKQLISEATGHYVGQSVKQLYVLVLGLDVLGNPYGLVIGITKGVEDLFYEPFQGAIQGPGEFAEGLVLGVRSLFGHTVGGAAGAVSRITGAMGKGIAALTFDKDFQRKRRDQLNKKPATVQEGFARGGKGLVMGVVDGVTGVFTKPISGAKEHGVEGFFKGLGKGAVGLVTRPTAGVIDFASGSLDAVKRVTEVSGEETVRLRHPRFLQADGLVRPYNTKQAYGNKLVYELEKGKYATTDVYAHHVVVIEKKDILLLTDKRVAYLTHNELFGNWQIDWAYTWTEIKSPATVSPKGVAISVSEQKKKKLGIFGSSDSGKIVLIADAKQREDLCCKIEELRRNA